MPLTIPELEAARDTLRQAEALALGARRTFWSAGDHVTASRLGIAANILADETAAIERSIQAAKP
jgi:hypothetical protein